ncbi:MAG: aa3-type cytochrome c oxidase subunit IV [Pseudomonadota bacterium]|nr:aa3-type cytochrome c oxidase subunit IV [Pseudomonadota bacterium]
MAAEGEVPEKMVRDHRRGYEAFVALMKWGAIVSLITTLFVILIIS